MSVYLTSGLAYLGSGAVLSGVKVCSFYLRSGFAYAVSGPHSQGLNFEID